MELGIRCFYLIIKAIEKFIEENDQFSSLDDLLNDAEYVSELSRYHV